MSFHVICLEYMKLGHLEKMFEFTLNVLKQKLYSYDKTTMPKRVGFYNRVHS